MDASELKRVSTDQPIVDMKAVVADAEALLKASANQPSESYGTAKDKSVADLNTARAQLVQADQTAIEKAKAAPGSQIGTSRTL